MTARAFTRALRARGIRTQKEAALVLGMSQGTISAYLRGKTAIPRIVPFLLQSIPQVKKKA